MNRQTERRKLFQFAMAQMPWTTTEDIPEPSEAEISMYDLSRVFVNPPSDPPKVRNHVKMIPRRVRRSMARDLAKRRWEVR